MIDDGGRKKNRRARTSLSLEPNQLHDIFLFNPSVIDRQRSLKLECAQATTECSTSSAPALVLLRSLPRQRVGGGAAANRAVIYNEVGTRDFVHKKWRAGRDCL